MPPAVVARLGVEIGELEELHGALTRVVAAARAAPGGSDRPDQPPGR